MRLRLGLLGCLAIVSGCPQQDAVLITVRGDQKVEYYDLYVRDDALQDVFFHSGFQKVERAGAALDITQEPLKIALKLTRGGTFSFLIVGTIGEPDGAKPAPNAPQLFWAHRMEV